MYVFLSVLQIPPIHRKGKSKISFLPVCVLSLYHGRGIDDGVIEFLKEESDIRVPALMHVVSTAFCCTGYY